MLILHEPDDFDLDAFEVDLLFEIDMVGLVSEIIGQLILVSPGEVSLLDEHLHVVQDVVAEAVAQLQLGRVDDSHFCLKLAIRR